MRLVASLSANTVHMLLIWMRFSAASAKLPNSSTGRCRARAMNSRNLPVPAAQRSFISNLATLPWGVMVMTLVSWPPMSRTVLVSGAKNLAPRA